jgi:hypothetical protein
MVSDAVTRKIDGHIRSNKKTKIKSHAPTWDQKKLNLNTF